MLIFDSNFFGYQLTIHKNDFCLTKKSPKTPYTLSYSALHSECEFKVHFEIDSTFLALFQFSEIFTHNFFVYYQNVCKLLQLSSRIMQPYVRHFCFHRFVNRWMAEQKWLKMKNGHHLEAAGLIKLKKASLKSENYSVLSQIDGFFGYFCPRTNRLFVNRELFSKRVVSISSFWRFKV